MEEKEGMDTFTNSNDNDLENNNNYLHRAAGILTKKEILDYKLIERGKNTSSDCLKPTTFDLTLGEGHYVYGGGRTADEKKWELIFLGDSKRMAELNKIEGGEPYSRQNKNEVKTLTIPAYGSALIQLNETVDTYSVAQEKGLLIVGRFDLKLGNVHKGLISQQATQVEPYYNGKLFCFIHNLSNREIKLKYGDKIATIEFSYVSDLCKEEVYKEIIKDLERMNKEKYEGNLFCTGNGIDEIRYFREQERLPDDCGLLGLRDQLLEEIRSEKFMKYLKNEVGKALNEISKSLIEQEK